MYDDINGLIHLSELSNKAIENPSEAVKLGQKVRAKLILLDTRNRKIGLSMKALFEPTAEEKAATAAKRKPATAPVARTTPAAKAPAKPAAETPAAE